MSRENVEILERLYEAEFDSDDILRYLHPEVELYPGIKAPDQHTRYVGRDGWTEFIRGATETWESVDAEAKEMLEATDDRVLVVERWLFQGRDDIEIERQLQTLFTFRDGLIVRIAGFTDAAEAREAAGLDPGAAGSPERPLGSRAIPSGAAGYRVVATPTGLEDELWQQTKTWQSCSARTTLSTRPISTL